jgi:hypothetical protein
MSDKSIADKLLIKSDGRVWTSDPSRSGLLGPLPDGAGFEDVLDRAGVAIVFADGATSLRVILAQDAPRLARAAVLWIAYPKGNRADLNRDSLWPILAEPGLRPISQVAMDEVWSALRFRPLRPGEPPFTGGG